MDCKYCKKSCNLEYRKSIEVRLPFENKESIISTVNIVDTHVFCVVHDKVVEIRKDDYCEFERGVFDDYPEKDFDYDV